MPRNKREVEAALISKGFKGQSGDHNYFIYWSKDGKKSLVKTMTSHTKKMKDITDNLIGQMARQCKVSKAQFLNLVDCPMSRDEYEEILKECGAL